MEQGNRYFLKYIHQGLKEGQLSPDLVDSSLANAANKQAAILHQEQLQQMARMHNKEG
jgi:hypothetical protein